MLILLSGPIGCGKTTLCRRLAATARRRGLRVGGILAPAVIEDGEKVGIEAVDLICGEVRLLARVDRDLGGACAGRYSFDDRALAWSAARCVDALASDGLVFVDEIGRLELDQEKGLVRLIPTLAQPRTGATVTVVRDALLDALCRRVAPAAPCVVRLDPAHRGAAQAEMETMLLAMEG